MSSRIARVLKTARELVETKAEPGPVWSESENVCALADVERHLGHASRIGQRWIAYDGIHMNAANSGFRIIGTYATRAEAKIAIENSVRCSWVWEIGGMTVEHEVKNHSGRLSVNFAR